MWLTVLLFGLFVFVGGLVGYFKSGSLISLITGVLFGTLLIVHSVWVFKKKLASFYRTIFLSSLLAAFFIYRLIATHRFFPAGLMTLLSLAVTFALLFAVRRYSKKK
jgi:uncharacterized membrane protein (UPF0136 family)